MEVNLIENYLTQLSQNLDGNDDSDYTALCKTAPRLGLYVYGHDSYGEIQYPFRLEKTPAVPLHIDMLPPAIRDHLARVRFADVTFGTDQYVQPMEQFECHFWTEPGAYIGRDGKTIHPVTDQEMFIVTMAEVRENYPQMLDGLDISPEGQAILESHDNRPETDEEDDYPAAHSMDATWFAVDGKGQVAVFYTGENGHKAVESDFLGMVDNHINDLINERCGDEDINYSAHALIGIYYYCYGHGNGSILDVYALIEPLPEAPLHIDMLPPAIRCEIYSVALPVADFAREPYLQPLEYGVACTTWGSYAAFLHADGRTISPFPGHESEFAREALEFLELLHSTQPGLGPFRLSSAGRQLMPDFDERVRKLGGDE